MLTVKKLKPHIYELTLSGVVEKSDIETMKRDLTTALEAEGKMARPRRCSRRRPNAPASAPRPGGRLHGFPPKDPNRSAERTQITACNTKPAFASTWPTKAQKAAWDKEVTCQRC